LQAFNQGKRMNIFSLGRSIWTSSQFYSPRSVQRFWSIHVCPPPGGGRRPRPLPQRFVHGDRIRKKNTPHRSSFGHPCAGKDGAGARTVSGAIIASAMKQQRLYAKASLPRCAACPVRRQHERPSRKQICFSFQNPQPVGSR